jgi:hypothetical protein
MDEKIIELLEENNRLLKASIILKYVELNENIDHIKKHALIKSAIISADKDGDLAKRINKRTGASMTIYDPER